MTEIPTDMTEIPTETQLLQLLIQSAYTLTYHTLLEWRQLGTSY